VSRTDSNGESYDDNDSIPSDDIPGDVESSNDTDDEDGHVAKYPMSLTSPMDSILVTYAALTILVIE